jgi:hypothetical protein
MPSNNNSDKSADKTSTRSRSKSADRSGSSGEGNKGQRLVDVATKVIDRKNGKPEAKEVKPEIKKKWRNAKTKVVKQDPKKTKGAGEA